MADDLVNPLHRQFLSRPGAVTLIIVDDDATSDPRVPTDVMAELTPTHVVTTFPPDRSPVMYCRASLWEQIKHNFKDVPQ